MNKKTHGNNKGFIPHSFAGWIKHQIYLKYKIHAQTSSQNTIEIVWIDSVRKEEMKQFIESLEIPTKWELDVKPYVYINHRPSDRGYVDPEEKYLKPYA